MDRSDTPSLEMLSAFADGEDVPADVLAASLALPGARECLAEAFLLRAALRDDALPSAAFYSHMERAFAAGSGERWWRRRIVVPAPLLAAAALLTVVLAAAWMGRDRPSPERPPEVSRLVRFEPGVDWHRVEESTP